MLEEWLEVAVIRSRGGVMKNRAYKLRELNAHPHTGIQAAQGAGGDLAQLLKFVWSSSSSSIVPKAGTRTQHPRLARACPLSLGTLLI